MKLKTILLLLLGSCLLAVGHLQASEQGIVITSPSDAKVIRIDVAPGKNVFSGDILFVLKDQQGTVIELKAGESGTITSLPVTSYQKVKQGDELGVLTPASIVAAKPSGDKTDTVTHLSLL